MAVGLLKHEQACLYADKLILTGFSGQSQRTSVERVVAHRLSRIEKPRFRRRLARDLRWRLRLASGTARPSREDIRAIAFPPLAPYERLILIDEEALTEHRAALSQDVQEGHRDQHHHHRPGREGCEERAENELDAMGRL